MFRTVHHAAQRRASPRSRAGPYTRAFVGARLCVTAAPSLRTCEFASEVLSLTTYNLTSAMSYYIFEDIILSLNYKNKA